MDLNKESLNISNVHEESNLRIGWLSKHSLFNNNFQYLFTERKNHEDNYRVSVDEVTNKRSLGMYGEHTVFFLHTYGDTTEVKNPILRHPKAKSHNLIDQVDAWLSEISPNTSVRTFLIDRENVDLKYNQGDYAYKPKHMGFGLSYALSVIVSLLTAREDKLIIIENPESHIHPRGQAELGRLIAVAAQTGAQLIIETHSDHILNGVRVAVKEQMANPDSIITYYFKRNQENRSSEISSIIMDEKAKLYQKIQDGTNAELPEGFFDEWTNSMFKLI
jgi:predicted ATPase